MEMSNRPTQKLEMPNNQTYKQEMSNRLTAIQAMSVSPDLSAGTTQINLAASLEYLSPFTATFISCVLLSAMLEMTKILTA